MLQIRQVIDAATLAAAREMMEAPERFADGRATAGKSAATVKHNLQLEKGPWQDTLSRTIQRVLRTNELFKAGAMPKAFCRLIFSRYETGMSYGTHVDSPIIGNQRTDLSFTLFLSDPSSYDGGELVIERREGETAVKLEAGDLVLYPSTALHRVEPVTRGVRLACVGWVRSHIRNEAHREILFDLGLTTREIFETTGKTPQYDRLTNVKANLMRLWAED